MEWNVLSLSAPSGQRISKNDQEVIQNLKHYLSQNYSAKIDLKRLAQMCYMSKSKLTYLFRTICGMTIYDFILNCRIERAKELLSDHGTGLTPNEFRKQYLK